MRVRYIQEWYYTTAGSACDDYYECEDGRRYTYLGDLLYDTVLTALVESGYIDASVSNGSGAAPTLD